MNLGLLELILFYGGALGLGVAALVMNERALARLRQRKAAEAEAQGDDPEEEDTPPSADPAEPDLRTR